MGSQTARKKKAREAAKTVDATVNPQSNLPEQRDRFPGAKPYTGLKVSDVTKAVGVTGLKEFRGIISEEYLPQLKGLRLMKVYQMMDDDGVITVLLDAIKMPLLAAEFHVTPCSDEQPDIDAAEFLETVMDDMNEYSWRQHVADALTFLTYGYTLHEIVMKKRMGPNGKPSSKYSDGKMGIKVLDPRGQDTIYRWIYDDDKDLEAVYQRHQGKEYTLPMWKLLHGTYGGKKRNPEGRSLLRSVYRAWIRKDGLEAIEAIGAERDLAGLPIIHLPSGASPEDQSYAEELGKNIRMDDQLAVVCPAPPPQAEHGWKIELLSAGGRKAYDIRKTIDAYITIILMRFFAQFLKLGMDKVGTQALVAGAQDFFSLGLLAIQQEMLEMWNGKLVPFVFNLNPWPGITGMPKIEWAPPGKSDIKQVVENLERLTKAQIVTPHEGLEDWILDQAGLPERPEDVGIGERTPPAPNDAMEYILRQMRQLDQGDMLDGVDDKLDGIIEMVSGIAHAQE